ncbi:PPC domain-containing protein [Fimbriimonas ginsengisoli]|uniref:Bacterial pre-peptidase C-terminal domain protein n=1 Tax=Fimbriimonas ginsengisoli Gsoil 348 TaxID=661478 RepID=A0A068NKS7_FIMGI|nr:PPC domain-containing protein [Fimbriimonas ginsengisoli]AIE84056.1 bacterial pre-peptidase C-terminal domain protein [Fimbriimonas ginsengisoli Gsoil 348]
MRFWLVPLLGLSVTLFIQQGGLGGGGFGGGGSSIATAPDGDPVAQTHILTPGDRGEWPIQAKEGETIIVSADSEVFDPALEVVDAAGKVLAQNDDVRPGQQNPLLVYRFAAAGTYKVLVKGYKSAAGGQYRFMIRRFAAKDATIGERTAHSTSKSGNGWLRYKFDAGKTIVVAARGATFRPELELIGPTGEPVAPVKEFENPGQSRWLAYRAAASGDYYLRVQSNQSGQSFAITAVAAHEGITSVGGPTIEHTLEPGGFDIWKFKAKAGDIVRAEAKSRSAPVIAQLSQSPKSDEIADPQPATAPFLGLTGDGKDRETVNVLVLKTGEYQISVYHPSGNPSHYSLAVSSGAKPLDAMEVNSSLALGRADFWIFEGQKGQIVRLEALSTQFDTFLELDDFNGSSLAQNDDGAGDRNAGLTLQLPSSGLFLVQVSSRGGGGSGSYTLKRSTAEVHPLLENVRGDGTLGSGGVDFWSFSGRAGQTIVLSARSPQFDTVLHLIGPDGSEVAANDDSGDGTDSLITIRLPLSGTYTVRLTGNDGGGQYSIRWIDLDR